MENDNLKTENEESVNTEIENKEVSEIAKENNDDKKSEEVSKKKWSLKRIFKILGLIILIALGWIMIVQYTVADKYDAMVQVKSEDSATGVNPTSEKLDYGDIPKGGSMIRSITINNGGDRGVYIKIIKYGDVAELIKEERNDFVIESGEEENIEFMINVPISAEERVYDGKVLIFKLPVLF